MCWRSVSPFRSAPPRTCLSNASEQDACCLQTWPKSVVWSLANLFKLLRSRHFIREINALRISQWTRGRFSYEWRKLGPLTTGCSFGSRCPLSRITWLPSSGSCTDKRPFSNLGMISSTISFVHSYQAPSKPSRVLVISFQVVPGAGNDIGLCLSL
jgi:hypothetical protein